MLPDILEESRLASFRVGFDWNGGDSKAFIASLDDSLHRIAKLCNDIKP